MQETRTPKREHLWASWLPLAVLVSAVLFMRDQVTAWIFMWALAFAIFAGLKWFTWWTARSRVCHTAWRSVGYLLVWPGMDADSFLDARLHTQKPKARHWFAAFLKTCVGAFCLWFLARQVPSSAPLLRGWMGMLGLVLLLHFGSFHIIALVWQSFGVAAETIMRSPLRSKSLGEFWGKRWNLGFRQLSHDLIFRPTYKSLGPTGAGFLVFVASGLLHDLVISVPARGGYGLPTLYFALQGAGVAAEHSPIGKRVGLASGLPGWLFMAVVTSVPAFWLFHPPFVRNVILPFMKAIGAL